MKTVKAFVRCGAIVLASGGLVCGAVASANAVPTAEAGTSAFPQQRINQSEKSYQGYGQLRDPQRAVVACFDDAEVRQVDDRRSTYLLMSGHDVNGNPVSAHAVIAGLTPDVPGIRAVVTVNYQGKTTVIDSPAVWVSATATDPQNFFSVWDANVGGFHLHYK